MLRILLITILSMILLCPGSTTIAREFTVSPLFIAGGRGSDVGEFGIPESVAIDSAGRIVVTDKGNMKLHVYSSEDGRALFDVGRIGSKPLEFDRPNGIAVDSQGRILVVEQLNRRVQILDPEYRFLESFGSVGGSDGEFQKAMGIAIDSRDRIYITDESRGDVQVFDRNGRFLWKFAERDPRLDQVESIEVHEASGRIFVCDEGKSRVNVYDLEGHYLHSFGNQGSGPGEFGNDPNAVRLDKAGRIYINDQGNTRINVYRPNTEFLASFYNSAGGMESADGLALSEAHNLFLVADQGNDRVLAFDLGAMQCQLAWAELPNAAQTMRNLAAFSDSTRSDPTRPFWLGGAIHLQAHGDGSSSRTETAVARLFSSRDRNGICVRLSETSPSSGLFTARVQLAERSDEAGMQLAVFAEDSVFAHLPGDAARAVAQLHLLPTLEVKQLQIEGESGPVLLSTDTPAIRWSFHDPAGLRQQEAFEVRVRREDGRVLWESGPRSGADQAIVYAGPALPPMEKLQLDVRLASEGTRSDWATVTFARNTPPQVPQRVHPPDGSVLRQWPSRFEADVLPDPEGHRLQVRIQVQISDSIFSSPLWDGVVGQLRWLPVDLVAEENGTLQWRLLLDDGVERTEGPWWTFHLNRNEEPPSPALDLEPADDVWKHGECIAFEWIPGSDPDPMQDQEFFFEWSASSTFESWQRRACGTTAQHIWEDPPEGTVFWRIRTRDSSGLECVSAVRRLHVLRSWRIRLQARSTRGSSEELLIGTRPGAQDGFRRGEDLLAVGLPGTPQIVALEGTSLSRTLMMDLRRPKDITEGRLIAVHQLQVSGEPLERVELLALTLNVPAHWKVLLRDERGLELGSFERPDDPLHLRLDATGRLGAELLVHLLAETPALTDARSNQKQRRADARPHAEAPATLQGMLAALPNPLHSDVRLLPDRRETTSVVVSVHDVRGRRLRTWDGRNGSAMIWDGRDASGTRLAPGLYLLRYHGPHFLLSRKVLWNGR